MKRRKTTTRTVEMFLGIVGSVIGIFSGSFLIFIKSLGQAHMSFLGFVAILASVLGLFSSYYLTKNEELAGIGFLIATMFVIVGADHINVISALFLLVAGILTLFRK
ncbi:hypothetical protein [Methanobrevibacter sp.]|uniref:hypothetical protein n=1 Tax=Methanobrevibacter sp. TaxID=66852 RepID=UPI002E79766C|nr:hypothetical protein [Methanobrevibacter sp.]MEE0939440.1 hypothetical protein [Methanobrevibacter sp.]